MYKLKKSTDKFVMSFPTLIKTKDDLMNAAHLKIILRR